MFLLSTILMATAVEPSELLGPWCTPGWPTCHFDLREDGVWIEASNAVLPWTLEEDLLIFDPGTPGEIRWQIRSTGPAWIEAVLLSTDTVVWFSRAPSPAPAILADLHTAAWPERASLKPGEIRWRLREPERWETGELGHPEELVVVDARADALRLVGEWSNIRVSVWVAIEGFSERVTQAIEIAPGITALPGAPVTRTHRDGKVIAQIAEEGLTVSGSIHPSALGVIYQPPPVERRFHWTLRSTTLYDADGEVMVEINPEGWGWWVSDAEQADGPRSPVTLRTAHLKVSGFVDTDALTAIESGGIGGMRGHSMWGSSHTIALIVPPETVLKRGEEIVAVTLQEATLRAGLQQQPPDIAARIQLPWGFPTVMVHCPDVVKADGEWLCEPLSRSRPQTP